MVRIKNFKSGMWLSSAILKTAGVATLRYIMCTNV